jgi:phage terminase large subunit-like protein
MESLVQVKGQWAGQRFTLLPWQRKVTETLFGTLRDDGTRQYRTCYVEVPRKNGKSTWAAAMVLKLLCADGEAGAEVYGAAGDRDQAGIVFAAAAEMARATSGLGSALKIIDSTKRIVYQRTGSFYRAIPADASGSHGFNASGIVLDEAHVQPNRELYDVLVTSVGARRQPLVFIITTAGYDRNSLCWELHEYARQVAAGIIDDPTFLPVLFGADEADDWQDEAVWQKANPSLGQTVPLDFLRTEAARAKEVPAYENTFRRLYLNQWTQQETRYLPMAAWDACAAPIGETVGRACWLGLDLSSTTDLTALAALYPDGLGYDIAMHFWLPEHGIVERERRDRVPYREWARAGWLTLTEGNVIDYAAIKAAVYQIVERSRVRALAYDPWNSSQLLVELGGEGVPVEAVRQGFASLSAPTKELLALVLAGRVRHGGNPVLRWMADNVMVSTDPAGNLKPDKGKSTQRIDGIVAVVTALSRAMLAEGDGMSVYESRELLVL